MIQWLRSAFRQDPAQRREHCPIGPADPRLRVGPAQHGEFPPQDQYLGVLRRRGPSQQYQPGQHHPREAVDQANRHKHQSSQVGAGGHVPGVLQRLGRRRVLGITHRHGYSIPAICWVLDKRCNDSKSQYSRNLQIDLFRLPQCGLYGLQEMAVSVKRNVCRHSTGIFSVAEPDGSC